MTPMWTCCCMSETLDIKTFRHNILNSMVKCFLTASFPNKCIRYVVKIYNKKFFMEKNKFIKSSLIIIVNCRGIRNSSKSIYYIVIAKTSLRWISKAEDLFFDRFVAILKDFNFKFFLAKYN